MGSFSFFSFLFFFSRMFWSNKDDKFLVFRAGCWVPLLALLCLSCQRASFPFCANFKGFFSPSSCLPSRPPGHLSHAARYTKQSSLYGTTLSPLYMSKTNFDASGKKAGNYVLNGNTGTSPPIPVFLLFDSVLSFFTTPGFRWFFFYLVSMFFRLGSVFFLAGFLESLREVGNEMREGERKEERKKEKR